MFTKPSLPNALQHPNGFIRALAASKPLRTAIVAAVALLTVISLFRQAIWEHDAPEPFLPPENEAVADENVRPARLHLLVPATSSNPDLCKLLLSTQILGYPSPVLINIGHPEAEDGYIQHMAKPQGILNYLESIQPRSESGVEYGKDLVLIVDGYDVWFQLRPDVLLGRYYEVTNAADMRTMQTYGVETFLEKDMRQTILFGPDKMCWPPDVSRPACWAVPETPLEKYAFGPQTNAGLQENDQPRWLNSGTILGPAGDLIELFRATIDEINRNYTIDSDQFYIAELWGRQEYARLQNKPDLLQHMRSIMYADEKNASGLFPQGRNEPVLEGDVKTEFHVGIDYASAIFQTMAFYKPFLTWTRPVDGWGGSDDARYQLEIPEDLQNSAAPYSAIEMPEHEVQAGVEQSTWADVPLLYNTATKQIPALFHIAGGPREKPFRQLWWHYLWFHSRAGELRMATVRQQASGITSGGSPAYGDKPIGGFRWEPALPSGADELANFGLGGAWADLAGGWFGWKGLCGMYEDELFHIPGEGWLHPRPPPPPLAEKPNQAGEDQG